MMQHISQCHREALTLATAWLDVHLCSKMPEDGQTLPQLLTGQVLPGQMSTQAAAAER